MPRPKPPRAERVFAPPADLLLTEEDLRAWAAAVAPALEAVGCSHPTKNRGPDPACAVVREVRPADWTVSTFKDGPDGGALAPAWTVARPPQLELRLRVAAPSWVQARSLELRLTGDGGCNIAQASGGYKSARALGGWLDQRAPRWVVPPRGRLPFAVGLRERNGWEGERWSYWLPIAAEPDVVALAAGAPVAPGRDMRSTPFDPPSLATFGAWRLELGYLPEWRARYLCATSRVGYMAYQNWSGDAAPATAALVAEARERGILRWRRGEGPGLDMWKGEVELRDEGGAVLRKVALA